MEVVPDGVMADHLAGLVSIAVLFFIISVAKFDALCHKLDLQPGDHLVEIGTGSHRSWPLRRSTDENTPE